MSLKGRVPVFVLSCLLASLVLLIMPMTLRAACGVPVCGNGILDPGEQCDDGNLLDGDGCAADCTESFDLVEMPTLFAYSGESPRDMEAADLNNDGLQDLLVSTYRSAYLYVYLMTPGGVLVQAQKYPLGSNTIMIDTGNLNGDRNVDVVAADCDTDQLFIFMGNGDGSLTLANIFDPGDRPRSVRIKDINTDGYADMIMGLHWGRGFRVYYGDGQGGFPTNTFIGTSAGAIASETFDVNGDGYNDLGLCTCGEGAGGVPSFQVYLGGPGGLTLSQSFPFDANDANAIDLNGDGYYDFLVTASSSFISYINQGDGTFIKGFELAPGKTGFMRHTGNLNNDGLEDVAIATGSASRPDLKEVRVYLGDGQGSVHDERSFPTPANSSEAIIYDVNLDGVPDALTSSGNQVIPVINHSYYQFPACGDSRIGRGESCDDGNRADGDGCSSTCRLEATGDTDHDGMSDAEESVILGTDPLNPDTDGDCVMDGEEYCSGADPLNPLDQPGCQGIVTPEGSWRIQVTLLEASAGLSSDIYLAQPDEQLLIKKSLKHVGKVATTRVYSGDTVSFFIRVDGQSMGLGTYDHYSDSIFSRVTRVDAYNYTVGFEDLPVEQADWDFNDVVLAVKFIPESVAQGVSVNNLDEFEAAKSVSTSSPTTVELAFDGYSSLTLPAGAVSSDAGVVLTAGLAELYADISPPDMQVVGEYYKATLTNGQAALDGEPASIVIAYADDDADGVVDGTDISENKLRITRYNEDTQKWENLASTVDPENNTVTASSDQMSLFALVPEHSVSSDQMSPSAQVPDNSHSSSLSCGVNEAAQSMPLFQGLLSLIPALALRFWIKRKNR
ncbi:MAG TPA: FG-GAP-like repeat-containing protein [bacterium]|nr:FG-GAP-like repeat-containing protein [bacterium]